MTTILPRRREEQQLRDRLEASPVVLLVGPRQSGKTTLARRLVAPGSANYFDLEDPVDLARLDEPRTALGSLRGLVVIDEVQLRPDLFGVLRVLVDRPDSPARFLVLGSAQPSALRQAGESLAGRVSVVKLGGLSFADLSRSAEAGSPHARGVEAGALDIEAAALDSRWLRGGFPRALLAPDDEAAAQWLADYARALVEGDLLAGDVRLPSTTLRRFLVLVAHGTGQIWNHAGAARSLGISQITVRRYLDLATDAMLVRQLRPWSANVAKRQVRAPKVYVRDCGLAHHLLGIRTHDDLAHHRAAGATWEGLVIEEVLRMLQPPEAYFWAVHGGAELDLFVPGARRIGVEVKRADAPRMTRSMHSALEDLSLDQITVIYPGERTYRVGERVTALPAALLADPETATAVLLGAGAEGGADFDL